MRTAGCPPHAQDGMAHHERSHARQSLAETPGTEGRKTVLRSPEAAAAHGKALYTEAMARLQQREQMIEQVGHGGFAVVTRRLRSGYGVVVTGWSHGCYTAVARSIQDRYVVT